MSSNDYIRIAGQIRTALERQQPFTLPLMTMADLGHVLGHLRERRPAA